MSPQAVLAGSGITGPVGDMPPELCWSALESTSLGRLAVASDAGVEIFPVNYAVDGTTIYFRTAPGSKLVAVGASPRVALEIDAVDGEAGYSVMVKGTAEELESAVEIDEADALPLEPLIPTLKLRWVRIRPTEVTGRAFRRGREPQPYA